MKKVKLDVEQIKKNPIKDSKLRWAILILACIVLMGDAFSFDNPQALETQLEEHFQINQMEFNMLYSVYSIPNIILPLIGGYLIDNCGIRINLFLFSFMLVVGQIIFTWSIHIRSFAFAIIGRFIFGIGSECLTISQTSLVSYWFNYNQLSLAVGLNLSLPRLGGALNSFLVPKLYQATQQNLLAPFIISTIICFIFSFIGSIVLICLDKWKRGSYQESSIASPQKDIANTSENNISQRTNRSIRPFENIFEMYPKYGIKGNEEGVVRTQTLKDLNESNAQVKENQNEEQDEQILVADIQKLPRSFWILMTLCSLAESLYIPFLNNANKLYQYRFGFSNVSAGNILVIPYLSACIFTPFVGIYMNDKQNRAKYILFSAIWFLITHLCFAMLADCQDGCIISLIPLIFLGLCFAVFASIIMPSIPIFINDEQILGTAFGIVAIFQNLLLSLFPLIAASIFEHVAESTNSEKEGFLYVQVLFVASSSLMVAMGVILYFQRIEKQKIQVQSQEEEKKQIAK